MAGAAVKAPTLRGLDVRERPLLLDLYCGAGGAAMGYWNAGFLPVGVDVAPQPHYPFEFIQHDALDVWDWIAWRGFAAVHASPPCQFASEATRTAPARRDGLPRTHLNLIPQTRDLLDRTGLPYVIENVPRARPWLRDPIELCGSSFDLPGLKRHRLFECTFPVLAMPCVHARHHEARYPANRSGRLHPAKVVSVAGHGGTSTPGHGGKAPIEDWRAAMGIDWMNRDELAQAIPPAYTEHIGGFLLAAIRQEATA
jgi:DNA (cytosine-5)-methyltransferase 1